jgi:uncharacterized membrane protein YhiD involved in acid resistance
MAKSCASCDVSVNPKGRLSRSCQKGFSLFGLLATAIVVAVIALVAMKVLPALNEYFTIERTIRKIADSGVTTVAEVRSAFSKQKEIEYSISSIEPGDLQVDANGDRLTISFAYDKEIELMEPVYLLIKFHGSANTH